MKLLNSDLSDDDVFRFSSAVFYLGCCLFVCLEVINGMRKISTERQGKSLGKWLKYLCEREDRKLVYIFAENVYICYSCCSSSSVN